MQPNNDVTSRSTTSKIKSINLGTPTAEDATTPEEWAKKMQLVAENGDKAAFSEIYAYFGPKVKAFGLLLKSAHTSNEMAEELVQDVMTKVWLKAASFNPDKASVSTWIFTIARNSRTDYLRKWKRQDVPLHQDDLYQRSEDDFDPSISLDEKRTVRTVKAALKTLPKEQSEMLNEVYLKGKTHAEVAESSGIPLGTVKSRVRLALSKLKGKPLQDMINS